MAACNNIRSAGIAPELSSNSGELTSDSGVNWGNIVHISSHLFTMSSMRASFLLVNAALIFATATGLAAETSEWPSAPSRLELDTPYGNLHVSPSEYVYESRLLLGKDEIQPEVKGLLNIPYAFSSTDFHVALVSIDTGEQHCPVSYAWIMLKEDGYSITTPFGSCSEKIRVSTKGSSFALQTPNADDSSKIDLYIYDGETVSYQKPASSK